MKVKWVCKRKSESPAGLWLYERENPADAVHQPDYSLAGRFGQYLLLVVVAISLSSEAGRSERVLSTDEELFNGFSKICPQRVVYRPTSRVSQAEHDKSGNEVIVLDPSLEADNEKTRRIFLAAHECAHHLLGHTSPQGLARRRYVVGVIAKQELIADCWAAEFLGKSRQGDDLASIAENFYRRGASLATNGYPSGVERALTITRCWRKGQKEQLATRPDTDADMLLTGRSD